MATVLISGGTGLIGRKLSKMLRERGYDVRILSRKPSNNNNFIHWDINKNFIQESALQNVDTIIHLAGEGIADKRWTEERKKEILESRIKSTQLLFNLLSKTNHQVKQFISASAIGYYSERGNELMFEDNKPASDFLGETCVAWEKEVDKISTLNIRVVKIRTGIVLSTAGGALQKMVTPFKLGIGSALGDGKQWMSWVHEDDLCNMYIYALENKNLKGAYNATAPNPVTNNEFSKVLASVLNRPYWIPRVPKFMLKLIFGEMAIVVLGSTKASSEKISNAGFKFKFENLRDCLLNLFEKK
jgi:uncharacterized protein (TIGR01777 family)